MDQASQHKTGLLSIVLCAALTLLVACGGGDGGKSPPIVQEPYQIRQCTVYRKTDGLTGLTYWGRCESHTWGPRPDEPIFNNLEACEARIQVLENTVSSVYNNSDEDKARGWARKLFCDEPDTAAPTVLSLSPADGSSGFPIFDTGVRVEFSENMEASTINTTTFTLENPSGALIVGTIVYYAGSRRAYFHADAPLSFLTTYTARLTTGITDNSGNALGTSQSWSFTTEDGVPGGSSDVTGPSFVTASPNTDSICGPQDGIITARFDELIEPAGTFTLEDSSGSLVDGVVTFDANKAIFSASLPLDFNEVYTARLGSDITDAAGNASTASDWSFRTELQPVGTWTPIATPANVAGRNGHTAVWTGDEMIVWGGHNSEGPTFPHFQYLTENGRYDPALDTWSSVSTVGAPREREEHTATWTGTEMIVWGGNLGWCPDIGCLYANLGGRYDPVTDTWRPMSTDGAPSPRRFHTAIWTGSELIIWGGVNYDFTTPLYNGARYDPATDTWSPLSGLNAPSARGSHSAVFDGQRMIVWGGRSDGAISVLDGAIYDPVSDVWSVLTGQNAPTIGSGSEPASVVSTGSDMFVWLPEQDWNVDQATGEWYDVYISQARRFNYQEQRWDSVVDACNPRATPEAVWLDGRLLSWDTDFAAGQSYDEVLDSWAPIAAHPVSAQSGASLVVADGAAIVWGGAGSNIGYRLTLD